MVETFHFVIFAGKNQYAVYLCINCATLEKSSMLNMAIFGRCVWEIIRNLNALDFNCFIVHLYFLFFLFFFFLF